MTEAADSCYAFLHIPKTGGTTVDGLLKRRFGARLQLIYDRPGGRQDKVVDNPDCYSAHWFPKDLLADLRGRDVTWFTWLRDPMRRAVSGYFYMRDVVAPQRPPGEVQVPDLQAWLTAPPPKPGEKWRGSQHNIYQQAFSYHGVTLESLRFVGLTERFMESAFMLGVTLGWKPQVYRTLNQGRSQKTAEERAILEDPGVNAAFRELNAADYDIYDRSCARLDELKQIHGPQTQGELERYERAVARYGRVQSVLLENPVSARLRGLARRFQRWQSQRARARSGTPTQS